MFLQLLSFSSWTLELYAELATLFEVGICLFTYSFLFSFLPEVAVYHPHLMLPLH